MRAIIRLIEEILPGLCGSSVCLCGSSSLPVSHESDLRLFFGRVTKYMTINTSMNRGITTYGEKNVNELNSVSGTSGSGPASSLMVSYKNI